MAEWTIRDLERWDERIQEVAAGFGLSWYPQEFEVCDQAAMLGYMAYHGLPSHYPHWSYGKAFEQQKTMYDHGVSGLPYEMVINTKPALAYLMRDNSRCLQILTMAHVYGHNDFFKNNFTFTSGTNAAEALAIFRARANRVRAYMEDPSIGPDAVEEFLEHAHAISFTRNRNLAMSSLVRKDQKQRLLDAAEPPHDPYADLHKPVARKEVDLTKDPIEPDANILLFIRDRNFDLTAWQRDLLTIVDEEACYFIPQIETKILNEGWASHWHHRIMHELDLEPEDRFEFMVRHNQVICPHPGSVNPYHMGFMLLAYVKSGVDALNEGRRRVISIAPQENADVLPGHDTCMGRSYRSMRDEEQEFFDRLRAGGKTGDQVLLEIRESDRDVSFLRRFLNEYTCRELDLFTWKPRGEHLVVSEVSDSEHWRDVRGMLISQTGTGSMPVIRIHDGNYKGRRALYMEHDHDGRDLDMTHADKTLHHIRALWGKDAYLLTFVRGKKTLMSVTDAGFDAKLVS